MINISLREYRPYHKGTHTHTHTHSHTHAYVSGITSKYLSNNEILLSISPFQVNHFKEMLDIYLDPIYQLM